VSWRSIQFRSLLLMCWQKKSFFPEYIDATGGGYSGDDDDAAAAADGDISVHSCKSRINSR
jgi:hypothetical protein